MEERKTSENTATASESPPPDEKKEEVSAPKQNVILPPPAYRKAPEDKFSKGRVMKYFPQSKYGFLKDNKGHDIYFNVDEVRFVGAKGREALKEGIEVGYDISWTSHGRHIARIKIY